MKTYLLTVWLLCGSLPLFAQIVSMKSVGADSMMLQLDRVYAPAIDTHFQNNSIGLIEFWNRSVDQLHYLQNDLRISWKQDTPCFVKFYFNKKGHIDYAFYEVDESVSELDRKRMELLLKAYVATYAPELTGQVPFSQAGQLMLFKQADDFSSIY